MRCLIASGLLCLLVVPVKALEAKPPEVKITRSASASDDPTRDALMDSVGPSSTEGDAAAVLALDGVAPVVAVEVDAKLVVYRPMAEVCEAVTQAAKSNNLPVGFFIRLLHQESGFKPDVVSRAGAQGVAQFMPEVAASMGVENPFDPLQAIPASARLLRDLFQTFGTLGLAAAAYNAGPRRIQTWLTAKKATLPEETRGYVRIITGKPAENWRSVAKLVPDSRPLLTHAPCKPPADEVLQVAEERKLETVRGKIQRVAVVALQRVAEMKTRMATKERPVIAPLKRGAIQIARAGKKSIDLSAKRGKSKPIKLAMGGRV